MTAEEQAGEQSVRAERFTVHGSLELELAVSIGSVAIHLDKDVDESEATESTVELRHDPSARAPWTDGMNAMLNWVGEHFAEQLGPDWRGSPATAIAQTRIEHNAGRLVVETPSALPLRNVPLALTVHAPARSNLTIKTGTADITVTGRAGRTDFSTGSGDITLDEAGATSWMRTGSGTVRIATAADDLSVRTGSGAIEISAVSGSASAVTSTGAVWFGDTSGDVFARAGSASVAVAHARSGSAELNTGSGDLRIGIGTGVAAEVDVSSDTGRVISELDVADTPHDELPPLTVHARTGTGNAVLRKSGV